MKLTYIGRHTAVEVDLPDGGGFTVEHGQETPELDEAVAASLLEQEMNWETSDAESEELAKRLAEDPEPESDSLVAQGIVESWQGTEPGDDHDDEEND